MSVNRQPENGRVVFVLGAMPRCGTNFLSDMLGYHPDCGGTIHITEDFLLANAEHLEAFTNNVYDSWNALWGEFDTHATDRLFAHLGRGLESFIYSLTEQTWVDKWARVEARRPSVKVSPPVCISRTPSVKNLHLVTRLTSSKVIIIVRDGRSVVESGMRSFGWFFEDSVRRWAAAVDIILQNRTNSRQILCVRYEDIVTNQAAEMRRILTFLELDPDAYDYTIDPPVRGSSTYFDKAEGISWDHPLEKKREFNPIKRWEKWSRFRHMRFNWLAGRQLRALGYEPYYPAGGVGPFVNLVLDFTWPIVPLMRRLGRFFMPKRWRDQFLWKRGKIYRRLFVRMM